MKLSVVMATLNEEGAIGKVIDDIKKNSQGHELEIVVVDSSPDRTAEIAQSKGAVVIKQPKSGHGKALRAAILAASGDIIMTTDCDDTYPMDYIPKFLELIGQGCDVVAGNRMNKMNRAMPLSNRIANTAFALIVRVLYGIRTNDVSTGMFAIKREVVHGVPWETNYSFPAELIIRSNLAGYKFKQIDIPYRERIGEVTLNKWRSGKSYLRCFFNYRFKLNIDPKLL
jgi:glycosyltransferase involved in cell wall biosynthesis